MKRTILIIVLLLIMISTGLMLDKFTEQKFKQRYDNISSSSALLDIIGEARYTLAAILWTKTDFYQHEYEFSKKDFDKNEPIMPLIRMVTLLDPHFVQAYDYGAYHLAVNLKKTKEGIEFIKEGLKNNPDSFDLNWEYGYIKFYEKSYQEALPYLLEARELRHQKTPVYDDYMKVVWVNSRLAEIYQHLGNQEKADFFLREMKEWIKANDEATAAHDRHQKELEEEEKHEHEEHKNG